jgi:pimeloyl-ACP methyl ester carboxylesterase
MELRPNAPAETVVQSNTNDSGDLTAGYPRWSSPAEVPVLVSADQARAQFVWPRPDAVQEDLTVHGLRCPLVRDGDGSPVLFVHGLGHDLSDWRALFARRNSDQSFWALDLPGFGLAEAPARLDMRALEDAVIAAAERVLDVTGRKPAVVASSLGGHVVMRAALRGAPFARLSLLAPGGLAEAPPAFKAQALALYSEDALCTRSDDEVVAGARRIFVADCAERERLAARKLALHRSPLKRDYMRPFAQVVEDVFETVVGAQLAALPVPAQLVAGAGDIIVPPALVQAAATAHDLPLTILVGVGHAPMLEAPDRLLEVVLPFIREEA